MLKSIAVEDMIIGAGMKLGEVLAEMRMVAEGVKAALSLSVIKWDHGSTDPDENWKPSQKLI